MSKDLTKYLPVFFTTKDEEMLSDMIRKEVPDLCWVDGSKCPESEPVVHATPSECQKNVIYPWSPSIPKIPGAKFQGPGPGLEVLFSRCGMRDGSLQDGFISAGYGDDDLGMVEFVKSIWKVLRSMKSATLTSYDPTGTTALHPGIANFVVGPDAASFASESPLLAAGIIRFKAVKKGAED